MAPWTFIFIINPQHLPLAADLRYCVATLNHLDKKIISLRCIFVCVELLSLCGAINEFILDYLISVPSCRKTQNNCFLLHRHLHLNVHKMVKSSVHNIYAGECIKLILLVGFFFPAYEKNAQIKWNKCLCAVLLQRKWIHVLSTWSHNYSVILSQY